MRILGRVMLMVAGVITLLFAVDSEAKLKGRNVIYLHGLQHQAIWSNHYRHNRAAREAQTRCGHGQGCQSGKDLDKIIDGYIYYHSGQRLSANTPYLKKQLRKLERDGTCSQGCYFMMNSTGDLVTRQILQNLRAWGISSRFWVIATFDFVGAGGGTEGADILYNLAEGNQYTRSIARFAGLVSQFFPHNFRLDVSSAGMLYNLKPSVARRTARHRKHIARLRIAARGGPVFVEPFLLGGDDGVVPLHSSCGARYQLPYWSCNNRREMGGKHVPWTTGPSSFMDDHFPILMARDMGHTQADYKGIAVPLNNYRTFRNGVRASMAQDYRRANRNVRWVKVRRGWFSWWEPRFTWTPAYTTIRKPGHQTIYKYVIDQFN